VNDNVDDVKIISDAFSMTRKSRAYHHGDLRQALVAAGIKLLRDKGRGALTLRACARAAGVSHAAPQHHFASLDDLLAEIAARGFEEFVKALNIGSDAAETPALRLEAMGRAYVKFALDNAAIYDLMFRQAARELSSPHLREAAQAAWRQLETAVANLLSSAPPSELATNAAFVWSTVHGLATLLIDKRFPPHVDPSALAEATAARVVAALKA
jgi:AcrR family transcriptional regulator